MKLAACAALMGVLSIADAYSASGASMERPEKIVLVSIDGLAGSRPPADMPALAALAGTAAWSGAACSPTDVPFPACVELLTGCGPERTHVYDEHERGLGTNVPTLAARLAALGVRGIGLPCDPLAHAGSGLARGFARYAADAPAVSDTARVDSALAWLREPGGRFAWLGLSFGAAAEPWRRTDGIGPRDTAAFAARARELDGDVARLRAGLVRAGLARVTLVAVTGTCAMPAAQPRVPIAFSGPGAALAPGPAHAPRAMTLAGVAPVLVAAAGGSVAGFDGVDAPKRDRGRCARPVNPDGPDPLLAPQSGAAALRAMLAGGTGRPDSMQLAGWDSLAARYPASARVALERDVAYSRAGREGVAASGLKISVAAHPGDSRFAIAYADHLLRNGRDDVVPGVLGGIAPSDPFAALAAWRLAFAYAGTQDFVAAEGAARRAAAMAAPTAAALETPDAFHELGMRQDSTRRAPEDAQLRLRFGRALGECGLFNAAYQQFHAARALPGTGAEPDYWLAMYLERQGRPQHAVPTLVRALERDPDYRPARVALADALMELGRRREAREQLERLDAGHGLDALALYNLACLRATAGETAGALDALERAVGAGYADWAGIAADRDLDTLRADARYRRLVERHAR